MGFLQVPFLFYMEYSVYWFGVLSMLVGIILDSSCTFVFLVRPLVSGGHPPRCLIPSRILPSCDGGVNFRLQEFMPRYQLSFCKTAYVDFHSKTCVGFPSLRCRITCYSYPSGIPINLWCCIRNAAQLPRENKFSFRDRHAIEIVLTFSRLKLHFHTLQNSILCNL